MNNTELIQILGKDYPKESIKYSYTGNKMKYKRFIKYPLLFMLIVYVSCIIINHFIEQKYNGLISNSTSFNDTLQYESSMLNILSNISHIFIFLAISSIIALVVLLIPRTNCLFLKISGNKKDIVLFKSSYKDEVSLLSNEINSKIKENTFHSFPY